MSIDWGRRRALLDTKPILRPCPFCGDRAEVNIENDWNGSGSTWVQCCGCGARTRGRYSGYGGVGPVFEYAENCFVGVVPRLSARDWNARPGEGTAACPLCGFDWPHTHPKETRGSGDQYTLTVPTDVPSECHVREPKP